MYRINVIADTHGFVPAHDIAGLGVLDRRDRVAVRDRLLAYLKSIPWARRAWRAGCRVLLPPPPGVQDRIANALGRKKDVFFVQVGSNDGKQGDPIHTLILGNQGWHGIFVEPVDFVYERLKRNYDHADRFIFENVAIGAEGGTKKFYYISERAQAELGSELPFWHDQLGSFERQSMSACLNGALEPYIVEADVECCTLQEVLSRHQVGSLDLLLIDTEGFDYVVLSQVDFARYTPTVIAFEHVHLSDAERERADVLLRSWGYDLFRHGHDTVAVVRRRRRQQRK